MTSLIDAVARAMRPEAWIETPAEDFEGTQAKWDRLQRTDREITIIKAQEFVSRLNATGTHVVVPVKPTRKMSDAGKYSMKGSADVLFERERAEIVFGAMLKASQGGE